MSTNFDSSTPLAYTGLNTQVNPQTIAVNRAPTTNDWQSFYPGDLWRDTSVTPPVTYLLRSVSGNVGNWIALGGTSFTPYAPITGGTTATGTLQSADSGLANVGWVLTSTGASSLPTWQASGAGSGIVTIDGDSGSVTGATVQIYANNAVKNCGSTVGFVNSGTTSTLNVTDVNGNTFIGLESGNLSIHPSAEGNFGCGWFSLSAITTGMNNTGAGTAALNLLRTGTYNTAFGNALSRLTTGIGNIGIGYQAGYNYTSSESWNISIGTALAGTTGESNTVRIGMQGGGEYQQNKCYIAGIASVATANSQFVTINTTSGQLGSTTVVPGAGINSVIRKVYTGAGSYTYTPAADTPGMVYCDVEIVGGGGGGGGATSALNEISNGGGGGAGGYAKKVFDAATIGASKSVVVGAGGAAGLGSSPGGFAGTGGTTTFDVLLSATGGAGGGNSNIATGNASSGGVGGVGSLGDINLNGNAGVAGFGFYASSISYFVVSGSGGSSFYGVGGTNLASNGTVTSTSHSGVDAFNYGSGGGGALTANTTFVVNGGAGSDGVVIITAYCT